MDSATSTESQTVETDPVAVVAINHISWINGNARASGGGNLRVQGASLAHTPEPNSEVAILFPAIPEANAAAALDEIIAECRRRTGRHVCWWSIWPLTPPDLGVRFLARGFEWGWSPHWMLLDLNDLHDDFPTPPDLEIAVDDVGEWDVLDLPYYARSGAPLIQAWAREDPRLSWHFAARLDGKIVGHSVLHWTRGRPENAGIYNVGVVPSARGRGIGRAVTIAACRHARALGCRHVGLNAATHIYDRIGFRSLGYGQTWWMHERALAAPPPSKDKIAFVEALGRGELKTLERLDRPDDLDHPLPCGMTPMRVAVKTGRRDTAEWLLKHGAALTILDAWDMGWKERITDALAKNPDLANHRLGPLSTTPLHEAAMRNDIELARLILTADPDLEVRDTEYHGTPLGWARHFQRAEIARLIEERQTAKPS